MNKKPPRWQTFTRRLDWNLLKVFYQIVQSEGVSNAAKVLLRKQPAVSASLRQLEELLQVKLCERGPSGFKLTAEGEKLYELVEEMVKLVRAAPDDLNKVLGELTGTLRICMISNVILPDLDKCLQEFVRDNPRIRLHTEIFPWQEAVNRVLQSQADIAVVYQRVPSADLHYQWLCREAQQLYCGPNHKLRKSRIAEPATLSDEYFILTGLDEAEEVASFRLRYGLGNRIKAISEDLSEVKRLIHAGIGVGFLPISNAVGTANQSALWPLFDESVELPSYNLWVVSPKPNKRSPAAERFVTTAARLVQTSENVRANQRPS